METRDDRIPPYREHIGTTRQYLRDIILGVNDGLVSMFLLVAGVVGAGLTTRQILLTAIAGAIAGAVSMGAGEYLATKSQEEVFDREIALELEHFEHYRDREVAELYEMFSDIGVTGEDLTTAVHIFSRSDERLMGTMKALEFGVVDTERRSPWVAMFMSSGLFLLGALPSVVPFAVVTAPVSALFAAGALAGVGLFIVGVLKTRMTGTNPITAGLENFAVAAFGGAVAYWVGRFFDAVVA